MGTGTSDDTGDAGHVQPLQETTGSKMDGIRVVLERAQL